MSTINPVNEKDKMLDKVYYGSLCTVDYNGHLQLHPSEIGFNC
jgi:hypothetical protein